MNSPKYCRYCLSLLFRREGEATHAYNKRIYCDKVCAGKHSGEKKK